MLVRKPDKSNVAWTMLAMLVAVGIGCGSSNHDTEKVAMGDAMPPTTPDANASSEPDGDADAGTASPSQDTQPSEGMLSVAVRTMRGDPVDEAEITLGNVTRTTSGRGIVTFGDIEPGRHVARVDARGYAPGSAVANVPDSAHVQRTVHLLESGDPVRFDAENGDDVYHDRVHLRFPANALVDSDGNPVTNDPEKPKAIITPLNPSTEELDAAPGPLMGVLEGESEPDPMESVLMANVQLRQDGERLRVAEGKTVKLEYVLPDDLQDEYEAGDTIEAYWYDRDAGTWIQEGRGEVRASTYASHKLAWFVDVSHFTWWNCDKPWTDKNCLRVNVIRKDDGSAVSGATVYAEGVTYNGYSSATTGAGGATCVDFKRNAKARISVATPGPYAQTGKAPVVTGSSRAAACSGQGGNCQELIVEVAPPTCLSGRILDQSGNPVQGVTVYGYYDGARGRRTAQATTAADGSYCLQVPQGTKVQVFASRRTGGTTRTASTRLTAPSYGASCGSADCTHVPDLPLEERDTGCLRGQLATELDGSLAGTHVRVYASKGSGTGSQNGVAIDCSKDPSQWGNLLAETTTNADGTFCAEVPVSSRQLAIVAGRCDGNGGQCLRNRPIYEQRVTTPATCGSGACTEMVEQVYLDGTCGIGP